ncbi:MAG: response regulator [Spirochaetia bacterium]|nr:response regulator [Spirochaetia bacterium]
MQTVRLLVVEDDPGEIELLFRAVRKMGLGDVVFAVKSGDEALEFLTGQGRYAERSKVDLPDVVLLDLKLANASGLSVLRSIRENPRMRNLPVVILTSTERPRDLLECYEAGANSCVVKPVDYQKVQEMITQTAEYWLHVNRRV